MVLGENKGHQMQCLQVGQNKFVLFSWSPVLHISSHCVFSATVNTSKELLNWTSSLYFEARVQEAKVVIICGGKSKGTAQCKRCNKFQGVALEV